MFNNIWTVFLLFFNKKYLSQNFFQVIWFFVLSSLPEYVSFMNQIVIIDPFCLFISLTLKKGIEFFFQFFE